MGREYKVASKKRRSLKEVFRGLMEGDLKLEKWQMVGILMLVVVFAGCFGWLYEFVFYFFNGGMKEFYMQGGNFLPWINIYAIGSLLILVACWKLRRWPWAVFLVSLVITGILEFVAGWLVYTIGNGTRYWDYNTEIWNFGNIEGFVCLRSVLIFGVSALFLMYVVVPFFTWLSFKMARRTFMILAVTLFTLVMIDEIYNLLASKVFGWPDAMEFWRNAGWKYVGD
jgi:uncharacterized membrane protein